MLLYNYKWESDFFLYLFSLFIEQFQIITFVFQKN